MQDEKTTEESLGETWPTGVPVPAEMNEDAAQAYLVFSKVDEVISPSTSTRGKRLTARQVEGVTLLALGLSDLEIEYAMGVAHGSWRAHFAAIRSRGTPPRHQLQAVVRPRASPHLRQVLQDWLRLDVLERVFELLASTQPPEQATLDHRDRVTGSPRSSTVPAKGPRR